MPDPIWEKLGLIYRKIGSRHRTYIGLGAALSREAQAKHQRRRSLIDAACTENYNHSMQANNIDSPELGDNQPNQSLNQPAKENSNSNLEFLGTQQISPLPDDAL